ncbi:MAG: hypothetical protein Q6373_018935, partial [Candidatus Sigynarchaeota archaeon]
AGLFGASRRTIRDAKRHPVIDWLRILAAAPVPNRQANVDAGETTSRPALPRVARPGASRRDAKLVPPEPEPEIVEQPADVDLPEPEFVEQDPDVDLPEPADPRDPLDDPVPRPMK